MNRQLYKYLPGFLVFLLMACSSEPDRERPGVLISTTWLAEHLDDPALVLLHVGTDEIFDSIHIPGARLADPWEFTISGEGLRNQVPDLVTLDSVLTSLGIGPQSRILLYYEDEDLAARTARVFVTLDYLGLGSQTSVINGGLTAWVAEERTTTNEVTPILPGDIQLERVEGVIASVNDVDRYRTDPGYVIGDSRSFEEYTGEIDSADQTTSGGHINGAVFLPFESVFSDSLPHMFKDDQILREAFEENDIDEKQTIIYYCGSGIRASVNYLVSVHLGFKPMLYDGSIEDWEERKLPVIQPVIDYRDHDE